MKQALVYAGGARNADPTIRLSTEWNLRGGRRAIFGFELGGGADGLSTIRAEWCTTDANSYRRTGKTVQGIPEKQKASLEPAYLTLPQLPPGESYDEILAALRSMEFYSFETEPMRALQLPGRGAVLSRDGANISSVIERMAREAPARLERVKAYLHAMVRQVRDVRAANLGKYQTLEFQVAVGPRDRKVWMDVNSVSAGTLRLLGILVALFQDGESGKLVGIEEPEMALHPGAAAGLADAFREASDLRQLLCSSHSPEIMDNAGRDPENLIAVLTVHGESRVAHPDKTSRDAIRQHLLTPGELFQQRILRPAPETEDA